jgi:hypothetical protein
MERREQPRIRRRMECELRFGGLRHRGVVVDASPDGLFVRTAARLTGAGELELRVCLPGRGDATRLHATPVRMQLAPEPSTGVSRCGVALRVVGAPESYAAFFPEHATPERPSDRCRAPAARRGASRAPDDGSHFESRRAPTPTLILDEELVEEEILLEEEIGPAGPADAGIEPPGGELPFLQTQARARCGLCHRDDRPVLGGVCVWCHGHERG